MPMERAATVAVVDVNVWLHTVAHVSLLPRLRTSRRPSLALGPSARRYSHGSSSKAEQRHGVVISSTTRSTDRIVVERFMPQRKPSSANCKWSGGRRYNRAARLR